MKNNISICVNDRGGELSSVKVCGRECIHQSDDIWKSQSPLLFPTIGKSFEDLILVNGKQYPQKHHGFARNAMFRRILDSPDEIQLSLHSNDETKKFYPYSFIMNMSYHVSGKVLTVKHTIENINNGPMFFNIGYHPGFNLLENTKLEQYLLEFEETETEKSITAFAQSEKLFNDNKIQLSKELFKDGAIVLNSLNSKSIKLIKEGELILDFRFSSPYLGIWTRPETDNPYLCLEPWYGLPNRSYCGDISKRPNIICLGKGKSYEIGYQVTFYK